MDELGSSGRTQNALPVRRHDRHAHCCSARRPAVADTVNVYANADAYVYQGSPDHNAGSDPWLNAGQQFIGGETRSLINFDTTSAVPADRYVHQVILHLITDGGWYTFSGEDSNIAMFEVDDSWSEGSVTWNTTPPLGSQIGTTTYAVTGAAPDELTWDVTSVWAESTNLDFYMAMTNPSTGLGIFQPDSRETTNDPYLEVRYEDHPIPEPGTLALVGLGLGGLLLKRRRKAVSR